MALSLKDAKNHARLVKEKEKKDLEKREEERKREEENKKEWAVEEIERRLDRVIEGGGFDRKKRRKIEISIEHPNWNKEEERLFKILDYYRPHEWHPSPWSCCPEIRELLWEKYKEKGWSHLQIQYNLGSYGSDREFLISLVKL